MQWRYAEAKHREAECEASPVLGWRSQHEMGRINAINERLKVKEDLH
jgi:hypothetical protein